MRTAAVIFGVLLSMLGAYIVAGGGASLLVFGFFLTLNSLFNRSGWEK